MKPENSSLRWSRNLGRFTLGIVKEITGRKCGRVFAYSAYLDILSEGAGL
jgi:hypothetical protein